MARKFRKRLRKSKFRRRKLIRRTKRSRKAFKKKVKRVIMNEAETKWVDN